MKTTTGLIILFGSGETLDTGRKIQRNVLSTLSRNQQVAIVETPAGFQPNSAVVADELASMYRTSLSEFIASVSVIPARKKGTPYSPDTDAILKPLQDASYIVLGPGSPTYAAKQLQDSAALQLIQKKWHEGATLVLSSAAAIAAGAYVLPVYEIYKAGADFYWEKGLDVFKEQGFSFSVLTHWDNTDGGEKLDTSHCFMGKQRFAALYELLPKGQTLLCIDEHTAGIFDITHDVFSVRGKGRVVVMKEHITLVFLPGKFYSIHAMSQGKYEEVSYHAEKIEDQHAPLSYLQEIPEDIRLLVEKRHSAKIQKDFVTSDILRDEIMEKGYTIDDIGRDQKVSKRL